MSECRSSKLFRELRHTPKSSVSGSPSDVRAIAKEAYITVFRSSTTTGPSTTYFVDRNNAEFKAPWNELHNTARVYTPDDKAIQTPNADTPYSELGADLRAEPLVLTMPPIELGRYYCAQFIDLYTFNFAYVGSRTTGNGGGRYLFAGPRWRATRRTAWMPVMRSETEFALVLYRTQLWRPMTSRT